MSAGPVWVTKEVLSFYTAVRDAYRDHTPLTWTIEGKTLSVTIDSFEVTVPLRKEETTP